MKKMNRWIYIIAGTSILLFAGMVYAWSVMSSPIANQYPEWSKAQLSITFTLVMTFFCLGAVFGGLLAKKVNVKINILLAAGLFLAGFYIASTATSLGVLYLAFGVCCGFASGLTYNAVLGTMGKWFPDKPGLVSGILLMGFGMGSFLIGKLYIAYTPATLDGWRTSFRVFGIMITVILIIGSVFFVLPTKEDLEPYQAHIKEVHSSVKSISAREMIRKSSFWFAFIWAIMLSATGLALISQAGCVVMEIGGAKTAAGTVATMVGIISISNGTGRVIFGALFDKKGQRFTMFTGNIVMLSATGILVGAFMLKSLPILIIAFILCGMVYGGVTATNAAFVNRFYGSENYAVNLSIINLNLMIASFGSTIAGMLYDQSGSYFSTFIMMAIATVIGFGSSVLIRHK